MLLSKSRTRTRPSGRPSPAGFIPLLITVATLAVAATGATSAAAKEDKAPVVKLDFEKYTLPNGLEVILRKDSRLPIVAVNLWYHVGPANEGPGLTGFAHLFEHMMFQASGHVPEDAYFALLEGAGASLVNGTTDFDRTNYMEDLPSNQLELALWLESDRMGFLLDKLDATMLATQQSVVRNERRQGVENAPYGLVEEAMWHELFPQNHPYRANVIGSHDDIQNAKVADVRAFFRRYYCPNNASLAIVGDIDVAKTKDLVTKYFGSIPRGEPVPPINAATPPIAKERRQVVTDQVELPRVYLAWISPAIYTEGDAEADLASRILGGGKASRLYKSLVYEQKIAQSVQAQQQSLTLGSVFQIVATAKPGHTADELEAAIDAELQRLASEGPTADEVRSARNTIWTQTITGLEHLGSFEGVANLLNEYNHHLGDPDRLNWDLARYEQVTPEKIKSFAAKELARERRVVIHGNPGEKVLPPDPAAPSEPEKVTFQTEDREPWRHQQPTPAPASTSPLPAAERFALSNGLPVYLVTARHLPVVAAHLVVRAGSAVDPVGREGLAGFMAAMLDEGAGGRDALAIARDLEAYGASLSTGASEDGTYVSGRALKQNASAFLSIMSDVVLRPAFPENEVERVRNDRLTSLLQQRDQPFQTAIRTMARSLYGAGHPYGHIALGNEEAIKGTTRGELVDFYRASFSPASAALVLAGDLTLAEARLLAEQAFGSWQGAPTAQVAPRTATPSPVAERFVVVDKPGAPQTAVLFGQVAVPRSHPDYEKLDVMNTVLGGLFASRINMNLREDKGYTYGAFSFMPARRTPAPLLAGAMVQADKTGASVVEIFKEVESILAAPITGEELTLARESISRSLPALFETTSSTVGTVGGLFLYEQAPDYYQGLPARLATLTDDEVFSATKRHVDPSKMVVVLVGDRAGIEAQVKPLGRGGMLCLTADGKPMAAAQ